jgi:hypothetical protein
MNNFKKTMQELIAESIVEASHAKDRKKKMLDWQALEYVRNKAEK